MEKLSIVTIPIKKVKEYENNAKIHSKEQVEQIKKSITEFGNCDPISVDEDYVIIEGHGRVQAMRELGFKEVQAIVLAHLSEGQKAAYRLVHNKLTMDTGFDLGILEIELNNIRDLDIGDIDLDDFGFSIDIEEEPEATDDDFDIDEALDDGKEPETQAGDIYELGRHRLMCGDSTDAESVALLLGGAEADLLITDPPYNVDYTGGTKDALKIMNDSMDDAQFLEFLTSAFSAANAVMRNGAAFYIWHADGKGIEFRNACKSNGWTIRQCLIWQKNTMVLGRQDYQWKHEPCLYGWKDGAAHTWASDRKQTTLLEFDRPTRSDLHPTMKPIPLFDYQIRNSTNSGDNVLDLFGGSGTTIIACEQNARHAYLMELDPKYCDVIVKRWEDYTGQKAVRINGRELSKD